MSEDDDKNAGCGCTNINSCNHGFRSRIKRAPYPPYTGNTYVRVAESFRNVNRGKTVDVDRRAEFSRLMKHISGK